MTNLVKVRLLVMSSELIKRLELSCTEQTRHRFGVRVLELCLHSLGGSRSLYGGWLRGNNSSNGGRSLNLSDVNISVCDRVGMLTGWVTGTSCGAS